MLAKFLRPRDKNSPKPSRAPPDPVIRAPIPMANWVPLSTACMHLRDRIWRLLSRPLETEESSFWTSSFDPFDGKDDSRLALPRTQVLRSRDTLPESTPLVRRYSCGCGAKILEKQKWLQMSQVFFCIRTLIVRRFCFSRILQAGPLNAKVPDSDSTCKFAHKSKTRYSMLITCGQRPGP